MPTEMTEALPDAGGTMSLGLEDVRAIGGECLAKGWLCIAHHDRGDPNLEHGQVVEGVTSDHGLLRFDLPMVHEAPDGPSFVDAFRQHIKILVIRHQGIGADGLDGLAGSLQIDWRRERERLSTRSSLVLGHQSLDAC